MELPPIQKWHTSLTNRMSSTYAAFPRVFWIVVGTHFIDSLGRTILFPFFALYITQKFSVGMTEAGALFGVFSVASFGGNLIGGALTDRFGRKSIILFGLVFSGLSSLTMGFVESLGLFFVIAVFVGLLSDMAGPAHGAMVADLLEEEKRTEGFGLLRVAGNLAWIVGPTIGGLLAAQSYLLLFISDAAFSMVTAVFVLRWIPETMPERAEGEKAQDLVATLRGYLEVLLDRPYVAFLLMSAVMNLVYIQLYSTLSVFLRDVHAVPERGFGLLMSLNASLVVLAQFSVTRWTKRRSPLPMMALGALFYAVGFAMYGFVAVYPLFALAMLIITVGEMIVIPVAQALVALFSPEHMRGRYMAVFSVSWGLPAAVGPWAAGLVLDNLNPSLVWYLGGAFSTVAVAGFMLLHFVERRRLAAAAPASQANP